jgi:hypothetical protein
MKNSARSISSFAFSLLMVCTLGRAQVNYDFNPTENNSNSGGTGIWDTGITPDFLDTDTGADTTFPDADAGNADFDGTPGTVTIGTGGVNPNYINVNADAGDYVLGASTSDGTITLTANGNSNYNPFELDGSSSVTFNAPIDIVVPDIANAVYQANFTDNTSNVLTVNSAITVSGGQVMAAQNYHSLDFTNTVFNGSLTDSTSQSVLVGFSGNSELGSSANLSQAGAVSVNGTLTINAGAVEGGNFSLNGSSQVLLRDNASTSNITTYITGGGGEIIGGILSAGVSSATSNFNGQIGDYGSGASPLYFTAVAGDRFNLNNMIYTGQRVAITGAGTVAFNYTDGNQYASGYRTTTLDGTGGAPSNSDVGTEIQSGTLLINNTTGSATGAGTNQPPSGGYNNVVQIDSNASGPVAVLGGTGSTSQTVVAIGPNSSITPGDPTVNNGIGTLHLASGLIASSGLTMNFSLNGDGQSSLLDLGSGTLVLNGPITINFTSTDGSVNTDGLYQLLTGTGDWSSSDPNFIFNGPDGYMVSHSYFSSEGDYLSVSFAEAPEPATWAMLAGGLGFLALLGARRSRRTV